MKNKSIAYILPILSGFFVMGFCDIVGFSSDYVQRSFGWSDPMTGFVPSLVFIWFLFLGILFIVGLDVSTNYISSKLMAFRFGWGPEKANQISGLMITAIAGGGVVTPAIGIAISCAGMTAGLSILLICVLYLVMCSFLVE